MSANLPSRCRLFTLKTAKVEKRVSLQRIGNVITETDFNSSVRKEHAFKTNADARRAMNNPGVFVG